MISANLHCKINTTLKKIMNFAIYLRWFCASSSCNFRLSMSCFCFSKSFSFILTICLRSFSFSCYEENENATHCQKRHWHLNWKMMSLSFFIHFISYEFFLLWIAKSCSLNTVCELLFKCSKTFSTFSRRIECV